MPDGATATKKRVTSSKRTSQYVLTLPRVVELLCKEGLADIERNEPSWNRGRMLSRDATGVRRVEAIARKNGINLNRTSLNNLLPRSTLPTRNPSVSKTLEGIKQMLDLWTVVDPGDPEYRRIQFASAGEIADLHARTYPLLEGEKGRLRESIKTLLKTANEDQLKQVEQFLMQGSGDQNGQAEIRGQLEKILQESEQIPINRLTIVLQSHLAKAKLTKLAFAEQVPYQLQTLISVDAVAAQQRAITIIDALLSSLRLVDDVDTLQALLTTIADTAQVPNESRSFKDIDSLLDYCGFPPEE